MKELGTNRKSSILLTLVVRVITPLSAVILIPVYVSRLSKEEYGLWLVILGLMNYLGLANFGIAQTVANEVAKMRSNICFKELSAFVSTAWSLYLKITGAIAVLVLLVVSLYAWPRWQIVHSALLIMALSFLVAMPLRLFSVSLRSFERIHEEQTIQAVVIMMRTALVFWALLSGMRLLGLAITFGVTNLLPPLVARLRLHKLYPSFIVSQSRVDKSQISRILNNSSAFFVIQIAGLIAFSTDSLLIAYFMGAESVPDYAVPAQMILLIQGLITSVGMVFYPMVARNFSIGNLRSIREMYLSVMYIQLALGSIAFVVLYLLGSEFMYLFVGPSINIDSYVLLLLSVLLIIQLALSLADMIVMATSNHKGMAFVGPVEALVNFVLSVWWIQVWGVPGVIAATIVGRVVVSGYYLQRKAMKMIKVNYSEIRDMVLRSLVAPFSFAAIVLHVVDTSRLNWQHWQTAALLVVSFALLLPLLGRKYIARLLRPLSVGSTDAGSN